MGDYTDKEIIKFMEDAILELKENQGPPFLISLMMREEEMEHDDEKED